jgi:hypothetical protein
MRSKVRPRLGVAGKAVRRASDQLAKTDIEREMEEESKVAVVEADIAR